MTDLEILKEVRKNLTSYIKRKKEEERRNNMEITKEMLKSIYDMSSQLLIANKEGKPDSVRIESNGDLTGEFSRTSWGQTEIWTRPIKLEDLTKDLEKYVAERKRKKEEERIKQEKRRRLEELEMEKKQKEARRRQYVELKKEFEPDKSSTL